MRFSTILLSLSLPVLTSAATAQYLYTGTTLRAVYTPYVTQSRGGNVDKSIGNSWLGGSVHGHMFLYSTTGPQYERGSLNAGARATVKFLKQSANVVDVSGTLSNTIRNRTDQTTSGRFRVRVLGFDYINKSFTRSENFTQRNWTFNVFPVSPSVSVPVGPVSVTVRGNVGAGLGTRANYLLPAANPQVGAYGLFSAYATGDASVGVGVPGFGVGVGIDGKVLNQDLTLFGGVNVRTGFYGTAAYTLTPISIRLYAWAQALWTWRTTLTSWTSPQIHKLLF